MSGFEVTSYELNPNEDAFSMVNIYAMLYKVLKDHDKTISEIQSWGYDTRKLEEVIGATIC